MPDQKFAEALPDAVEQADNGDGNRFRPCVVRRPGCTVHVLVEFEATPPVHRDFEEDYDQDDWCVVVETS